MKLLSVFALLFVFALFLLDTCYSSPSPSVVASSSSAENEGMAGDMNNEIGEDETPCTVKVTTVKNIHGKCVRLRGGSMACQSESYLDPVNEDCSMFG